MGIRERADVIVYDYWRSCRNKSNKKQQPLCDLIIKVLTAQVKADAEIARQHICFNKSGSQNIASEILKQNKVDKPNK